MSNNTSSEATLNRLEQCFKKVEGATEPICIAVIAESHAGQNRAIDEFCRHHSRERIAGGRIIPLVRIRTPSRPTVKGIAGLMLSTIGADHDPRATETRRTMQLIQLLKKYKTQAIVIEHFHHFANSDDGRATFYATEWLKELADSLCIMLCVSGLEHCRAAIIQNQQFASRFVK